MIHNKVLSLSSHSLGGAKVRYLT
ncbi:hypothetical protein EMIT0232MI5_20191 [Pseudomonas sp. IT-232MI5]